MKTRHPPPHGFDKFLQRARDLHGDRFQYDRFSWKDADKNVRIQCSAHGWFEQIARNHIRPKSYGGCGECFREESWARFLCQAQDKHGNRFEYDKLSWSGSKGKVRIKCGEHGWFAQQAFDHLRLMGCGKCSQRGVSLQTTENVVSRFKELHGNRYDYSDFIHAGSLIGGLIKCKTHGFFKQSSAQHLKTQGCPKCSGRHRWTTEEFIENSKAAFGGKFTYDNTIYTGSLDQILVTCPKHGDFSTQPSRHITRKDGCPKCDKHCKKTTASFIEASVSRFGDRYDYSRTVYVNSKTPVEIICQTHGIFEQLPQHHLQNSIGCRDCSYNVSGKEISWLNSLGVSSTDRQKKIKLNGAWRGVDAYCKKENKVFEFHGDWWHGNPLFFKGEDIHPKCKKTYGELYRATLEKKDLILKAGYKLVEIWEHEYDQLVKDEKITGTAVSPFKRWTDEDKKYELTDEQWSLMAPFFRANKPSTKISPRNFLNAALWVIHFSANWTDIPAHWGSGKSVRSKFYKLQKKNPKFIESFNQILAQQKALFSQQ